jgi:hypothetical protein
MKIARYVSYNPTRSLFSFWGEESVIPNCLLLVMSGEEFMLMKENWSKWYYFDDEEKIDSLIHNDG